MRILVDTNVFLDLVLRREQCQDAIKFFIWCKQHRNQTYVTSMSLRDIEYIAMKKLHDKKKANQVLADVYSICSKVIGVSADSAITAIYEDYKDFEDELLVQSATEELLDAIVTNNVKDFKNSKLPAYTPKDIISLVSFKEI